MVVQRAAEYRVLPELEPEPEQDGSPASVPVGVVGLTVAGLLGKIAQGRTIAQAVRGNAHYRGLAAALVGDVSLAVQETKRLWRDDGLLLFVKWPALMVGTMIPYIAFSMGTEPLFDQALGVSEEDIEERTPSFHISRMLNSALLMLAVYPFNNLLACYVADTIPSWKVALDRVIKRKDHFYSSWLASAALGPVMHTADALRAKVLHWHKATFFPDFMPPCASDEEADDEEEAEEEEEPSTARCMAYGASTALASVAACGLCAALTAPMETITIRIAAQPHIYGPLGTLGTVAAIYRQEGVWGFFHGLAPAIIAQCLVSSNYIEAEADTGKPQV